MRLSRRAMLGGTAGTLGLAALPASVQAATPHPAIARLVVENASEPGRLAERHAVRNGWSIDRSGQDIASRLYASGSPDPCAEGMMVAVTGYSAFVVAQGFARERGRQLAYAVQLRGGRAVPLAAAKALPALAHLEAELCLLSRRGGSTDTILWAMA